MYGLKPFLAALPFFIASTVAWPSQSFKTIDSTPPVFEITKSGQPLAPGLIFLTPDSSTSELAIIIDDDGNLIWSSPSAISSNLFVQTLYGAPVMHYWNGTGSANVAIEGHGYGHVQILDTGYNQIFDICPNFGLTIIGNGTFECQADLHESYITNEATLLVTAYNLTQANLRSVGGAVDGWVADSLFYEIDIQTQEVLFSWSALASGIGINSSKLALNESGDVSGTEENPFDWFHINSVQKVGTGYLINGRNVWTSFMLSAAGDIQWQFEGSTGGDFHLPTGANFLRPLSIETCSDLVYKSWEHHVRAANVTSNSLVLTMFDNANGVTGQPLQTTRGLQFSLDLTSKVATLLQNLFDPNEILYVETQGAFNSLPNGNTFMDYGQLPVMKEYGPDGDVRMTIQFGDVNSTESTAESYRGYRLEWDAVPTGTSPALVVQNGILYMSWNGATNITSWAISTGSSADTLHKWKNVTSTGFETNATLANATGFVHVDAMSGGQVIGSSSVLSF
ncbi:hypothetical protein LAWI1_G003312 [Lachnellula willkommii]|uniref:ASST-domain-containing protein n=1 Tax=Lachnellula willkommii TaxID=215461 RepID=A0A559MFH3_9HELO|nr:hypothetical protein LAWI1_G003312 [Lachnellula willkommii]